jgi:internalin A
MKLSSEQLQKLRDALINAFPSKSLLQQMLCFTLEKKLDEIVGGSGYSGQEG